MVNAVFDFWCRYPSRFTRLHTEFFGGGGKIHVHRATPSRGVWGMLPHSNGPRNLFPRNVSDNQSAKIVPLESLALYGIQAVKPVSVPRTYQSISYLYHIHTCTFQCSL